MAKTNTGSWSTTPNGTIDSTEILNHTHEIDVPSTIPKGVIMYWDKSNGSIPTGWSIYTPLLGCYPKGASDGKGTYQAPALPNITGHFVSVDDCKQGSCAYNDVYGAFGVDTIRHGSDDGSNTDSGINFDASRCSSIYTDNFNSVRPPTCLLVPIIKD